MRFIPRRFPPHLLLIFLLVALCLPARAAEPQWVEVRSPHFSVLTDAGEGQGREVAQRLEQMRAVFGALFQRVRVNLSSPLQVLAFRNRQELQQALPLWQGKPMDAAGVYQGGEDRDFIAVDLSAPDAWRVLYHEYAHLLLRGNYPPTQPWFDEGFAQYYSTITISRKEVQLGAAPEGVGEILNSGPRMSLVDLFSVQTHSKIYNERGSRRTMFYAQSWLVVHYLFDMKKLGEAGQYFSLVKERQVPVAEAIRQAFGMDAKQLEKAIDDFSHSSKFLALTFPLPEGVLSFNYAARKLEALEAQAAIADMHLHAPDTFDRGVKELEDILKQQPGQEAAERGLGFAYLRRGDFPHAGQHLGRAAELDSKDARTQYYLALLMQRVAAAHGQPPADPDDMRRKLNFALAVDPDFADAYNLLAYADMALGDHVGAFAAIKQAIQLNPRNQAYQLHLAEYYLHERRWDDAEGILQRLKESSNTVIAKQAVDDLAKLDAAKAGRAPAAQAQSDQPHWPISYDAPQWRPQPGQPVPDVTQPIEKPAEAPPDTRPVRYLAGTLVSMDCGGAPAAVLTLSASGKLMKFRVADRDHLLLIGADAFSCDWRNRKVLINYKPGGSTDGDVVSLEFP